MQEITITCPKNSLKQLFSIRTRKFRIRISSFKLMVLCSKLSQLNADSKFVIANYLRKDLSHLYLLLLLSYIITVVIIYLNDSFVILIFHLKNSLTFKMTEMTIFVTRVFSRDIYFLYFSLRNFCNLRRNYSSLNSLQTFCGYFKNLFKSIVIKHS